MGRGSSEVLHSVLCPFVWRSRSITLRDGLWTVLWRTSELLLEVLFGFALSVFLQPVLYPCAKCSEVMGGEGLAESGSVKKGS